MSVEEIVKLMGGVAGLIWPVLAVVAALALRRPLMALVASVGKQGGSVKLAGFEVTVAEVAEQQQALIADLQKQVGTLQNTVDLIASAPTAAAPLSIPTFFPPAESTGRVPEAAKLTLRMETPFPGVPPVVPSAITVGRNRLIIGAGAGADWVLPSPDRTISRLHAEVECRDGSFYLTDCSVNGTFLNDATERLAGSVLLAHGDVFTIGDYAIRVDLGTGELSGAGDPAHAGSEDGDPVLSRTAAAPPRPPISGRHKSVDIVAEVVRREFAAELTIVWVDGHPESNAALLGALEGRGLSIIKLRSVAAAVDHVTNHRAAMLVAAMAIGGYFDAGVELIRKVRRIDPFVTVLIYGTRKDVANYGLQAVEAGAHYVTDSAVELIRELAKLEPSRP